MAIRKPTYHHEAREVRPEQDSADLRRVEEELPDTVRHHTRGLLRRRVTVRNDGTLSIPAELREVLALAPGKVVEMEITTGGCLLVRPPADVDAEQWWWRTRQLRPSDQTTGQQGRIYMSSEEFLAALEDPDH